MKKYQKLSTIALAASMLIGGTTYALIANNITNQNTAVLANMNTNLQTTNIQTLNGIEEIEYIASPNSIASVFGVVRGKSASEGDRLYAWGNNFWDQLGTANIDERFAPRLAIGLPADAKISYVLPGRSFTIVILANNEIWATGTNGVGQFGNGAAGINERTPTFILVSSFFVKKGTITSASVGEMHTAVVINNHDLYTWGGNDFGQLGTNNTTPSLTPVLILTNISAKYIADVKCGGFQTYVRTVEDGVNSLFVFGLNTSGQLGSGGNTNILLPTLVIDPNITGYSDFFVTPSNLFVLVNKGHENKLYGTGVNTESQLGLGDTANKNVLTAITLPVQEEIIQVAGGQNSSMILFASGTVYSTGSGDISVPDNGLNGNKVKVFTQIPEMSDIVSIMAAVSTNYAFKDNAVYTWGISTNGQFGNGGWSNSKFPIITDAFSTPSAFVQIDQEITDINAVASSIYANDTFNFETFKQYFDVVNFPPEAKFEMTTAPIVDEENRTVQFAMTVDKFYSQSNGAKSTTPTVFTVTLQGVVTNWALIIGLSVGIPVGVILIAGLTFWYIQRRRNGGSGRGTGRTGEWFSYVKDKLDFSNMFARVGSRSRRR